MELPQVALVGSQSSCKDRQTKSRSDEWGEFFHIPYKRLYDISEIRREIEAETNRENKGVRIPLTLVDLLKVPDIIRSVIVLNIEKPSSLILSVRPAITDLANSDALQIAGIADSDGHSIRTMGVITKLDIMDRVTDVRNHLLGKAIPLRLGYVGVVDPRHVLSRQLLFLLSLLSAIPSGSSEPNLQRRVEDVQIPRLTNDAKDNDVKNPGDANFLSGCAVGRFFLQRRVEDVKIPSLTVDAKNPGEQMPCHDVKNPGEQMPCHDVKNPSDVNSVARRKAKKKEKNKERKRNNSTAVATCDTSPEIPQKEPAPRELWTLLDGASGTSVFVDSLLYGGAEIEKLFTSKKNKSVVGCQYVVLQGYNSPRACPVAIKRIPRSICEEDMIKNEFINQRQSFGKSKKIMEAFAYKLDSEFSYIVLEHGVCQLDDLVKFTMTKRWEAIEPTEDIGATRIMIANVIDEQWKDEKLKDESLKDWFRLSPLKLKLIRDIVEGVYDMHKKRIVHRKLEPRSMQIVLSGTKNLAAKISEFSASKFLSENEFSFRYFATDGSRDWQAREQLVREEETSAVDLFSLGCVIFYVITGKHPFGSESKRTFNITSKNFDISQVDDKPEAFNLIYNLLNHVPATRFSASQVMQHPLFWKADMRLSFLRAVNERMDTDSQDILKYLERIGRRVMEGYSWDSRLSPEFLAYVKKQDEKLKLGYDFKKTSDLLRMVRNTLSHYSQLPEDMKQHLGTNPDGFDQYITPKFPHMVIEVYVAVLKFYKKDETVFQKYI